MGAILVGFPACKKGAAAASGGKSEGLRYAILKTDKGAIKVRLFADKAPATVENFIGLAAGTKPWTDPGTGKPATGRKYYDGLLFHRVVPGFMIQTGDPTGKGDGGPGFVFKDECRKDLRFDRPGVLGMANFGPGIDGAGTNGGQFFITLAPKPELNGLHTVFGEVVEGLDVAKAISKVPRDEFDGADRPLKPVRLRSVEVVPGP